MAENTPDFAAIAELKEKLEDTPEVDLPEIDAEAVAAVIQAFKDSEAAMKAVKALVAPLLHAALVKKSREDGKVYKGVTCGAIQYIYQNRYSALSAAKTIESAKERVGRERYVTMFAPAFVYEIPVTRVSSELSSLLLKHGIRPKMVLKPTKAYHDATIMEEGFGEVSEERKEELKAKGVKIEHLPKNTAYVQRTMARNAEGKAVVIPVTRKEVPEDLTSVLRAAPVPAEPAERMVTPEELLEIAEPKADAKKAAAAAVVKLKTVRKEIRKAMKALAEGGAK
jgi:hypothetical protein